jgi:hypothetical protein
MGGSKEMKGGCGVQIMVVVIKIRILGFIVDFSKIGRALLKGSTICEGW